MASFAGPPPGLPRPKPSEENPPSPPPFSSFSLPLLPGSQVLSPTPRRATGAAWTTSLMDGLFPPSFSLPLQVPPSIQPLGVAVPPAECLRISPITNLAVYPAPSPLDPWHIAHSRVCAHANQPCAGCSVSLVCCSCRALRFTPGPPPVDNLPPHSPRRSRSASPALFRDVGNAPTPPGFNDANYDHPDDDAYLRALAEFDTCDNISCPRGTDAPASWTLTVEQFDEGTEEFFDRTFRACGACNRSCKKSFMSHKIKSRAFDNSTKANTSSSADMARRNEHENYSVKNIPKAADCMATGGSLRPSTPRRFDNSTTGGNARSRPVPGSIEYAREHPTNVAVPLVASNIAALQDVLHVLNTRPSTPAAFVATVRVQHDALCSHDTSACQNCSLGLMCCGCNRLFIPAVARHLACVECKHIAFTCCTSTFCCKCNKLWMPTDSLASVKLPARRFHGGAGSNPTSSPEPDIWTPSPRSSPDEIDDLTARAALPLPVSRSESDASRAPSRASSVGESVNVAATPLPTPDYSSLPTDTIDGFIHPSFPDHAILDERDRRHFIGRGDLSIASLKLYARRIFTDTSHWITAGHFLVDIFQGSTLNGSRDDFRRFVILVGTQLGFGDLAQSMSESLDVNRKMADEYMRLRDVATTWKQKAKANSKDAKTGRKAQDELNKAQGDIALILEERDVFIKQRNELLSDIKRLNLELSRVHKDYSNAIDDNTKYAADIESFERQLADTVTELNHNKNALSMAEHHRNKAEFDLDQAVHNFDKVAAEKARDKAFYEARITALTSTPVPTSQPDSEAPLSAAAIDRSVLITRLENMKKELSVRDAELAKLRSEVSLSDDVNTLRAELAEAKAVSAHLSGMYEQKSKDFRESELERLSLLGKQILADGEAPKTTPPARPRPSSRRGRQRSRSTGRAEQVNREEVGKNVTNTTPASSQPFWQDEPLFTKQVAAVTTATMSALPHLPFETAIANAFATVRNVGPPPPLKLDKKPRRSAAPSPPTPAPAPAPTSHGNFTFADIARTAVTNADNAKKKPTWRAMETSKALVLRPSTKGTRVSELHLKVPKTADSADLFKLKGSALLERVAKLINEHSEPAPRMALRENPLVFVKWSMRGNLVLKCAKPMDDLIKDGIKDAIAYFFPSPSAEVMILNKPPTTALKFLAVPRHNLDGSDTDDMDLLNDLTAHPVWADIELWSNPKFINLKAGMAGATVVVSVVDDNQGNVGRRLMGTMVEFSGCTRPCKRWVELPAQPFCSQCQSWGHPGARCPANVLICARCGGTHDFRQHDRYCETCKKGPGHSCTPFCRNCRGNHMSTSHECPFWKGRTSKERHAELYAEVEAKFPKSSTKNTGTTRKNTGRKKVGFSGPDAQGFVQVGSPQGIARIDAVPDPEPEPSAPASVKPPSGSIVGAIADEALWPELKGNEEARRLMQETLLDEAAFAAADAAAPSGSPPLSLSYA
ncbi:hypothetical protein AX14_003077 [Amanita brunnescens Koide BX004]|nr:hypothetical protein AX14_003077 [Amanita brunnescens Koide BX004]